MDASSTVKVHGQRSYSAVVTVVESGSFEFLTGLDYGSVTMPKNYIDELAEWVKQREATRPRQDKNTVAFLAVRDKVQSGIEVGYSLKTIWEHLRETGRISYRYETFLKHVHRHIAEPGKRITSKTSMPTTEKATKPDAATISKSVKVNVKYHKPASIQGFTFNPNADKKDLL